MNKQLVKINRHHVNVSLKTDDQIASDTENGFLQLIALKVIFIFDPMLHLNP
jgi:hypothetical protein